MNANPRPGWRKSALLAGLVSALFVLAYGGSNLWTASLGNVASLHLPWERSIPLLPWSVLPYWSLDLLFLGSFFLLGDRDQLLRHSVRLAAAIVGAALLFLVFPLTFAWTRPVTDGIPGLLFVALSADQPFNQLPSLHVALALLIWPVYRRRSQGLLRAMLGLWFVIIALSTVTTWQHHLVDVFGGLGFGILIGYLLPLDAEPRDRVGQRHRRLAWRYGWAALALSLMAATGGMALLLLWPAMSLALVASAYASGRRDFLKSSAQGLPACSRLLFGPWLVAMWLNVWLRRKHLGKAVEIQPGLWLGPHPAICGLAASLERTAALSVVSLAPEVPQCLPLPTRVIPALDLVVPDEPSLAAALAAMDSGLCQGPVYLHCALGYGRSAQVAAAYLQRQGLSWPQACEQVRQLRPGALPGAAAVVGSNAGVQSAIPGHCIPEVAE